MKVAQLFEEAEPLIIRLIRQRFAKGEKVGRYVKQGLLGKKWVELKDDIYFSTIPNPAWWIKAKDNQPGSGRILVPDVDKWGLEPHSRLKKTWVLRRIKLEEGVSSDVSIRMLPLALRILLDRMDSKKRTYLLDTGIFEDAVLIYSVDVKPATFKKNGDPDDLDIAMMVEHPETHSAVAVGYFKETFELADIKTLDNMHVVVEMK